MVYAFKGLEKVLRRPISIVANMTNRTFQQFRTFRAELRDGAQLVDVGSMEQQTAHVHPDAVPHDAESKSGRHQRHGFDGVVAVDLECFRLNGQLMFSYEKQLQNNFGI